MSTAALFDDARARLADAPREALGELVEPRRVLGIARAPRIVPRGTAWHLGVLLLADDARPRDRRHRPRARGGAARVRRRVAAAARRTRRGRAPRRVRRGRDRAHRMADAGSRRGRSGRGIRSAGPARRHPERAVERRGRRTCRCDALPRRAHRAAASTRTCARARAPGLLAVMAGPNVRANARSRRAGSVTDAASTRPAMAS